MAIQSWKRHLILLCILLLGSALRLAQPTLVPFKRDEATIARLGQAIAHEGFRPPAGVDSSLGIDNLPLTLYLMALPLRVWSDPLSAVIFTILLNSLALPACYLLGRALVGRRPALLATLLFAVSPWAVLYARKIWARTLPLFTVALMASLWLAMVRRRPWALVASFAALAALLGLQLEALAFVPIVGLLVLRYWRELRGRALAMGVLVFLVLLAPYVLHDARQGWQNARGLVDYAQADGTFSWDAVRHTLALLGSQGIEGQAGPRFLQFRRALGPLHWLNHLLSGLFIGGVVYGLHQALRAASVERRRTFGLLLLWIAVPVVLQLRPANATQQHYFVMHYPAQYLLIGALVMAAWDRLRRCEERTCGRRRLISAAGALVLVVTCGWQLLVTCQLRTTMVAHPSTGGYGIPLRYKRRAAQEARRLAPDGEIVVLSRETRSLQAETPTVFDALLFGTPHRFTDARVAVVLPERGPVAYLITPELVRGASDLAVLYEVEARGLPLIPGASIDLADALSYETYLWEGGDRAAVTSGMRPQDGGVPFANDVVFVAVQAPESVPTGAVVEVWLAWWVRTAPAPERYHFTVQLLDDEGRKWSQDDHAGFPTREWHAGDLVLSRFQLPLPSDLAPGVYSLRGGMYSYPEVQSVPVVDPRGAPVDDGVGMAKLTVREE